MKYVFEVIVHYKDGGRSLQNVVSKDDIEAKEKGLDLCYGEGSQVKIGDRTITKEDFLKTIEFCEIRFNCKLDD
jgi:hypothetical protein